jgi:Fe-S cluster assembly scaffold protein SufB
VTIGQVTYQVGGRVFNPRVIAPDGVTILSFTGTKNFDGQARAVAHMPDGRSLRFPVQGTSRFSAVMAATDDAGSSVFRLRQVRNTGSGQHHKKVVEILVEPGRQITPEMLLAMATGYYNLCTFFDRSAGG